MEAIKVRVCVGTHCCFSGGEVLIEQLETNADLLGLINLEAVRCIGRLCEGGLKAPVVEIDGKTVVQATLEEIMELIEVAIHRWHAEHDHA